MPNMDRALALLAMEPNEPMAYVEDINEHCSWPSNWLLGPSSTGG